MPLNTKIPQQIVSSTTQALSVKRGEPAMLVADMNRGTIVLMDGKTYGGIPAAREDTQIRAGSSAITVNDGEWSALTGTITIGINPEGFIEDVVSSTDKVLAVGDDGKIAAQLSVAYDETSGLFSLKGKDGETISSFTLAIPTGITPKSVALVENPEGQEPGLYLEFVFIDDDDMEIKLYANMDVLKDVYTAGRGIIISDDRVISVDEDAISGVIADDLIGEGSGLKVVDDKLHLDAHASSSPEYGLGDEDNYGHVRLADAGDSRATVQAGIAATPAAVKDVDDRAVHKEGDETVSGVKTFVNAPKVTLSDGSVTEVATVDGTVWNKRVEELPEDMESLTENMPVGALLVMPSDGPSDIFQVVDQDGQKALVEVPVGSDAIWGRYVPGTIPDNPAALIADLPVGAYVTDDKPTAPKTVPAPYNTEEWITESGDWTAPVTTYYDVTCISGGEGGHIQNMPSAANSLAWAGKSGTYVRKIMLLHEGDTVNITVGSGGIGYVSPDGNIPNTIDGGDTKFGNMLEAVYGRHPNAAGMPLTNSLVPLNQIPDANYNFALSGAGFGGGMACWAPQQDAAERKMWEDACWYGGGGAATLLSDKSQVSVGDGYQGVVHIRYYDPNKEND